MNSPVITLYHVYVGSGLPLAEHVMTSPANGSGRSVIEMAYGQSENKYYE